MTTLRFCLPSGRAMAITPLPDAFRLRHLEDSVRSGEVELSGWIRIRPGESSLVEEELLLPRPDQVLRLREEEPAADLDPHALLSDLLSCARGLTARQRLARWLPGACRRRTGRIADLRRLLAPVDVERLGLTQSLTEATPDQLLELAPRILGSRVVSGLRFSTPLNPPLRSFLRHDWIPTHSHPSGLLPPAWTFDVERARGPFDPAIMKTISDKLGDDALQELLEDGSWPSPGDVNNCLDRVVWISLGRSGPSIVLGKIVHARGYSYLIVEEGSSRLSILRVFEERSEITDFELEDFMKHAPDDHEEHALRREALEMASTDRGS